MRTKVWLELDALVVGWRGLAPPLGPPPLGVTAAFDVNELILSGKSIRGIVEGDSLPQRFIPELMNLYLQGRFAFDKLGKFYSFEQINEAVSDSENGTIVKPILRIGG